VGFVNTRHLSELVATLTSGRPWGKFEVDPEDVDILRAAIDLRAARPGDAHPETEFVSGLYESLKGQVNISVVAITRPPHRRRAGLVAAAAGLLLVGGTVAETETLSQREAVPAALGSPRITAIRTGTFESIQGRVAGQIVAYGGNPSWVVMNVDGSGYSGPVSCTLLVAGGSSVSTGVFTLHAGKGDWSNTIHIETGRLRGANLVTPSGAIVASATFA
jgi:hypothetical protein